MIEKNIKVLDCTIRDGGLVNKWQFSDDFVKETIKTCNESGVEYIELGYKASTDMFDPKEYGKWRFCKEDDVKKVIEGIDLKSKLACMVDIGRVKDKDIVKEKDSPFKMYRVACYVRDITKGINLAKSIMDKGYEATVNIMAVSTNLERDVDNALEKLAKTDIPYVYAVDSFGSMYKKDISNLVKKYTEALPGKTIGVHCHNNQQLAFSNTIQAIDDGSEILDASVYGIGRGAGNCPLELLIGYLRFNRYKLRPIIKLIENQFVDLRGKEEWGYLIPYMITGRLNAHPRSAIQLRSSGDKRNDYTEFFDSLTIPNI